LADQKIVRENYSLLFGSLEPASAGGPDTRPESLSTPDGEGGEEKSPGDFFGRL
jgi:hypothetical protein